MNPKQNFWLYTSKKFLLIEFILLALVEISRLTIKYGWLDTLCGSGSPSRIYPTGAGVPQIIPSISCSDAFGRLGAEVFLVLFLAYLVSFIIYRLVKKNFRGAVLPIIIIVIAFLAISFLPDRFSSEWETYKDENIGFRFEYPRDARLRTDIANRVSFHTAEMLNSGNYNFSVTTDAITTDLEKSMETLKNQENKFLKKELVANGNKFILSDDYGTSGNYFMNAYLVSGQRIFNIEASGEKYDPKMHELFEKIVSSFEIVN